ncbi:hypothetical protein EA187_11650 [Lujinxingia sediminis]|uniref:Uncharacterized protein n=1 Tax=Lujinxingia sediminis TaxID=2480984 RepID=A0ABY0CSU2_9DELT|nr:hypothetical protein [Lujinxingia sediminis]RVU43476.1 hypothetical protein EA187_11650 [Lujinxingia sediminis]
MSISSRIVGCVMGAMAMLLLMAAAPSSAHAQPWTLEGVPRGAQASEGLHVLSERGAELGRVLVAERVVTGRYLLEVEVRHEERRLRLPMIVARTSPEQALEVIWAPVPAYVNALLTLAGGDGLPPEVAPQAWVEERRLPALPIIATRARIITPYGEAAWQSPELSRHIKRWLNDALTEAGGPAGIDLLLDRRMAWSQVGELMMNAAAAGLFRVHLITRDRANLGAISTNLPIFPEGGLPEAMVLGVLGVYPHQDDGIGVGVRLDEQTIEATGIEGCREGLVFCARDGEEFEEALGDVIADAGVEAARITHWLLAGSSEFNVGQGVRALVWTYQALNISPQSTFIGYIE